MLTFSSTSPLAVPPLNALASVTMVSYPFVDHVMGSLGTVAPGGSMAPCATERPMPSRIATTISPSGLTTSLAKPSCSTPLRATPGLMKILLSSGFCLIPILFLISSARKGDSSLRLDRWTEKIFAPSQHRMGTNGFHCRCNHFIRRFRNHCSHAQDKACKSTSCLILLQSL